MPVGQVRVPRLAGRHPVDRGPRTVDRGMAGRRARARRIL